MVYWLRPRGRGEPGLRAGHAASTTSTQVKRDGKTGGFLTFEGFEPLESDLKLLDVFYDLGLRMASLTHSRRNFFADGTQMGVKTRRADQTGAGRRCGG